MYQRQTDGFLTLYLIKKSSLYTSPGLKSHTSSFSTIKFPGQLKKFTRKNTKRYSALDTANPVGKELSRTMNC